MKFNFKKVASVLAATIMLGSTVSFAAAAWPAPFVADGSSASAVVYGANAPSNGGDKAAAINLGAELDKSITSTVSSGSSSTSGDMKKIEKTNDKFNLGNKMNDFYATLDNEDMTKVLANGVYTNDNNDEYKYEQSIALGALNLTHFSDSDFNSEKALVGFQLNNDNHIMNYTLEFTPDAAENGLAFGSSPTVADALETTNLEMLGMSYYIVKVDTTSNGLKLTLLDNANEATVSDGEEKTVTVGDNSYNVKIAFVDTNKCILEVNGVKTNKLGEGDVFKVAADTYVAVKDILYNSKESGISQIQFSIGSGKIVLENKQEVQLNGEAISDTDAFKGNVLKTFYTNTSMNLDTLTLEWNLDDDAWLAPGSDLVLPGFKTIKLSMTEFTAPKAEKTTLKADGDTIMTVSTELTDGAITLPILYSDDDQTNFTGIGEKSTKKLVTLADGGDQSITLALNETQNSYFVVSWVSGDNYESTAFEIDSITDNTGKNSTVLKNLAGGSDVSFSEVGDTKDKGSVTFTLTAANRDAKTATVTATCASPGKLYSNKVVTNEGLVFTLPVLVNTGVAADGNINLNATTTTNQWIMNFTEEDPTNGNIMDGKSFRATIGLTSDGAEVSSLSQGNGLETEQDSRIYQNYVVSDMATRTLFDTPSSGVNTLEVIYAGEESTASVYIAEASAAVGAVKDSVKVVTDAEVDSVKDKNLIVIGGSCINTVAASILGSTSPVCGDSWASQTGTGPGKYLIQVAASPVNAEKIAMLIAGYETADTQNAVAVVKEGSVSTDVGTKLVGPAAV